VTSRYSAADRDRLITEPDKRSERTEFERDRARVLHSSALRRLAAKTQVVMAGESDFPRTRLTHTLEVAQIARELGEALGADADVTDLAGLAHDLGHPPFGHNGEDALHVSAADIGGFEGNAQSLRVLTRLESKVADDQGRSVGLNLTRASLDSVIKYPWSARDGERKFNVYADDLPVFEWVRQGAPEGVKCFEAQVMDWSDDVAYSVHDVEDGVQAGHIDLREIAAPAEREAVCLLAHEWYEPWCEIEQLSEALDRIFALDLWPRHFDGSPTDMRVLKNMTSGLIGRFVAGAYDETRAQYGPDALRRYEADLLVAQEQRLEVAVLKAVANLFVFHRHDADDIHQRQRDVLTELVPAVAAQAPNSLDPLFIPAWNEAPDDRAKLRVVIDQIACLTDRSVVRWHAHYCKPAN